MSEFKGKPTKQCVQRLQRELVALQKEPNELFCAAPDPLHICHWYYVLNGPADTPYANGRYIGEIFFPPNYPFAPPSISMLTPNGRFEVGEKICMSNTEFHQSSWSPLWNVASIINGLCSHWTSEEGGVGTIQHTADERRKFALASRKYNLDKLSGVYKRVLPECYNADMIKETSNISINCNNESDNTSNGDKKVSIKISNKANVKYVEKNSNNNSSSNEAISEGKANATPANQPKTTANNDNAATPANNTASVNNDTTTTTTTTTITTNTNITTGNNSDITDSNHFEQTGEVVIEHEPWHYEFAHHFSRISQIFNKPSMLWFCLITTIIFILGVLTFVYVKHEKQPYEEFHKLALLNLELKTLR